MRNKTSNLQEFYKLLDSGKLITPDFWISDIQDFLPTISLTNFQLQNARFDLSHRGYEIARSRADLEKF